MELFGINKKLLQSLFTLVFGWLTGALISALSVYVICSSLLPAQVNNFLLKEKQFLASQNRISSNASPQKTKLESTAQEIGYPPDPEPIMRHPEDIASFFGPRAVPVFLLTPEQCEWIITETASLSLSNGQTGDVWLNKSDTRFYWIWKKILNQVTASNGKYWKYDMPTDPLSDLVENLKLSVHGVDNLVPQWHQGVGIQGPSARRRLHVMIQLSNPRSYGDGFFELKGNRQSTRISRSQGNMLMFPSFMLYRLTPVSRGVRHTMFLQIQVPLRH